MTSPLQKLARLLGRNQPDLERAFVASNALDPVLCDLRDLAKAGAQNSVPEDIQVAAVRQFWASQRLESLKEARLVSFGLDLPVHVDGRSLMDDRSRFRAVLDGKTGVDQWIDRPRWYRRCFQGLVRSYFSYDGKAQHASSSGRQNWGDLRDYLRGNISRISDKGINPDWVGTAAAHASVFEDDPCDRYADAVLSGDSSVVDVLCAHLSISKASWFLRELILAQVKEATRKSDGEFREILPVLLRLLSSNSALRDRGLIMVLDRYANLDSSVPNLRLRDTAVDWWGNPWLPSNESRWGGVRKDTRAMVSDWLKREFVETFFEKLAKDGVGDRRRANFWLRYVKAMDNIQFALGSNALSSRDKDFVVLRKKMEGLYTTISDGPSENNAFIMTLGKLVAVEFGSGGNALYGYDAAKSLPFDVSRPVLTAKNARNSLKNSQRLLWLLHKDNIHGWAKWEDMFDATLLKEFSIRPNAEGRKVESSRGASRIVSERPAPSVTSTQTWGPPGRAHEAGDAQSLPPRYSKQVFEEFVRTRGLAVDDFSAKNGNLWVRYHDNNYAITSVLRAWGFQYKAEKGWWRTP